MLLRKLSYSTVLISATVSFALTIILLMYAITRDTKAEDPGIFNYSQVAQR